MIWLFQEDLNEDNTREIIRTLRAGGTPKTNSYKGRRVAEPLSGKKTLLGEPKGPYAPFLEKELEERKKKEATSQ